LENKGKLGSKYVADHPTFSSVSRTHDVVLTVDI